MINTWMCEWYHRFISVSDRLWNVSTSSSTKCIKLHVGIFWKQNLCFTVIVKIVILPPFTIWFWKIIQYASFGEDSILFNSWRTHKLYFNNIHLCSDINLLKIFSYNCFFLCFASFNVAQQSPSKYLQTLYYYNLFF